MLREMRTGLLRAVEITLLVALTACSYNTKSPPSARTLTAGRPWFPQAPIARNHFDTIYNKWRQRIEQPDIRLQSDTRAVTKVPEFSSLVGLGEPAVPFLLERLRQGYFFAVPVLEAVSRVPSSRLYPNPMPPVGTFGLQDVAQLWLSPQAAGLAWQQCQVDFYGSLNKCPFWPNIDTCIGLASSMCGESYQKFWATPPPP